MGAEKTAQRLLLAPTDDIMMTKIPNTLYPRSFPFIITIRLKRNAFHVTTLKSKTTQRPRRFTRASEDTDVT